MSLLVNRKMDGDVQLGVWKIEEATDELLGMLNLTSMEEEIYSKLKTEQRRRQWLSYRITIKRLLNLDKVLDINYDKKGKPKILNHYLRISVTHSGIFSAAILHKKKQTGIDIEKISERIHKVKHKFLSQQESKALPQEQTTEALHVYWGAKEAIYKMQNLGNLSFSEHIYIHPFRLNQDTIVHGEIRYDSRNRHFALSYERIEDYMLVYSVDENEQCEDE